MIEKKLSIFLAEDNPDDRIFFVKALKSATKNFELKIFEDGEKFVEYFQSGHPHPDFVFLDISLPRGNGIECLKFIKSQYPSNDFHVYMISDDPPHRHSDLCYRLGATAYIQKTHQLKLLTQILSYCLNELKTSAIQEDFVLNRKFLPKEQ